MPKLNKAVVIVLLVGVIGAIIFIMLDPSIKFPGVRVDVDLIPGESVNLTIPSNTIRQKIMEALIDPYTFVETSAEGLITNMGSRKGSIIPDAILGFLPEGDREVLQVFNPTNSSIKGWISGKRGPTIDQMSDLKTWWSYLFVGFYMFVAAVITYLKPSPTVNIRPVAKTGLGAGSGSPTVSGPRCGRPRNLCVSCLRGGCMRTCLPI